MSFLDIDTSDAVEPKAVAADEEYEIRMTSIEQSINKKGNPYLLPRFDIPSEAASKDFTKYLALPHENMTEKELNSCKWQLKNFFEALGIDASQRIDLDACVGETAWAILGVDSNEEYGDQNYIKRFVRSK